MKSSIVLFKNWKSESATAAIAIDNDQLELNCCKSAKTACRSAAKKLRTLADKFDALAEEDKPFSGEAQKRINK